MRTFVSSCCMIGLLLGCEPPPPPPADDDAGQDHGAELPTNRVPIPEAVQSNLGITFAGVERRAIRRVLRVPGRFELMPTARHDIAAMVAGRVDVLVAQFDEVAAGTPVAHIDAPRWRTQQKTLAQAFAEVANAKATIESMDPLQEAHARHEATLQASIDLWNERLVHLQAVREAGGGSSGDRNAARAALAEAQAELADVEERDAVLKADRIKAATALTAAERVLSLELDAAASMANLSVDRLTEAVDTSDGLQPRWRTLDAVTVLAPVSGVVGTLHATDGAWVDAHASLMQIVQPDQLRVVASALQSDAAVLRDGLPVDIVPPTTNISTGRRSLGATMEGRLQIGLHADPDDRTFTVYAELMDIDPWARPGVSVQLEVLTAPDAVGELAVPLAAVQHDGLQRVLFRRDPKDPAVVIRVDADLGRDDGRWVEVLSGLQDGDQVVLDGGYQLVLATSQSGATQKGGHFHSDGTWHEGEH